MNWRISQPNEDDLIVDMCLALNREDPGPRPVAVHQIRNTLMELRTNPLRGIIAVLDLEGRVEGYALLVAYWSNELGGEICNVDEIYVRPGWRRRGYGRALVEASPRLSAEQHRALAMLATAGRDGVTQSLLKAHGFGVSFVAGLVN